MYFETKDERHVEGFPFNIITNKTLDDEHLLSNLENGKLKLTKGSHVVARGKKC